MLKEMIREDIAPVAQRQCRWRNVIWSKDGRRGTGRKLYDSIEDAEKGMTEFHEREREIKALGGSQRLVCLEGSLDHFWYAWHMQIPILEGK